MQELNPIKPRHSRLLRSAVQRETVGINWAVYTYQFKILFDGLCLAVDVDFMFYFFFSLFSLHHSFLNYGHLWKAKDGNPMLNQISQVRNINNIYFMML